MLAIIIIIIIIIIITNEAAQNNRGAPPNSQCQTELQRMKCRPHYRQTQTVTTESVPLNVPMIQEALPR